MATVLITGAGRGFGLALVRELLALPSSKVSKIIASVRKHSPEFEDVAKHSHDRLSVVEFDVADEASITAAVPNVEAALQGKGLDILVNNAGIAQYAMEGTKSMDNLEESMRVNVLGVHWVTRNFLPLLQKGDLKKVANISSTLGSNTLAPAYTFMPAPAYKISKATLNALTVQYAIDHGTDGFSFMALSPGWMKTELGGGEMADLTPEQGAQASLDIIMRPNSETNGKFLTVFVKEFENAQSPNRYDGSTAPW